MGDVFGVLVEVVVVLGVCLGLVVVGFELCCCGGDEEGEDGDYEYGVYGIYCVFINFLL